MFKIGYERKLKQDDLYTVLQKIAPSILEKSCRVSTDIREKGRESENFI